jgi:TolB-like protein/tRNA A-37 threonylcarbamoyl transferase component Bud32/Tfp pilus assembly protein PilF
MNKVIAPSDFVADVIEHPTECSQCGAITRLDRGACINCLLREGLAAKGEASREAFESVLAEANVADTQWRLGHYEILEEIGRGGMGVIYRARQQHSRRIVAVKRILAHEVNSHETLARFRREAEAVASLDHPNILPIHEVSESEEGLPFFSMKYATGGSLRSAASALRNKPRECVQLMAKVARGIAYAHGKGVLHRDLQPGNILLDENGEPMVSDFGLAKWLDQTSEITRTLETLGTPGYIAPEQAECRADKLTCAADIYSLGAILFYLLTGRPPFVGPNVLAVIHQAAATPAPRLRSLAPSLDRDLGTIVCRCLDPDPNARYQSAGALEEDLDRWLRHEPIRARRTGVFTRGRKWVRRNPTSTVLVASLVAMAAMAGVVLWQSQSPHPMPAGIAVLPFENLSTDPENAFFTYGVQDEILNGLAKIGDLKVISRTSVMQYESGVKRNLRQIANELGVAHIVEGSVQRAGNRVRVTAQLIDAKTDTHLWVERYDRPLDDVFAIQSDIAKAIAGQLQAKLSPKIKSAIEERPTKDLAAYDLYVRAKLLVMAHFINEKNYLEAESLLDQAIARDSDFFLAHCLSAEVQSRLYWNFDHNPERRDLAERAVKAAFHLRPEAGESHLARAQYLARCNLDYDNARAELALAQRGLPNNAQVFTLLGHIDRLQGRWNESVRNFDEALELDPRNLLTLRQLSLAYLFMRRLAESAATVDRAVALAPQDDELRAYRASIDLDWRADPKPLHKTLEAMINQNLTGSTDWGESWLDLALRERDPVATGRALAAIGDGFHRGGLYFSRSFMEGCAARTFGDDAAARRAFTAARVEIERTVREQPDYGPPLCMLGLIDAGLGRREEAIREGRRASELLPVAKDAMNGAHIMQFLGVIYAWAGEKDLAIKQIAATLQVPSLLSYGELRLHPFWDPLRGDPRFENLVEESKKPVAMK